MLTPQEERVIILVKKAMEVAVSFHEYHFTAETAINDILKESEVALHPEAVEQLVEWLKRSDL